MNELKRIGKQTVLFPSAPKMIATSSVVGPKEGEGPLGKFFHRVLKDDMLSKDTFEHAERAMLRYVMEDAILKQEGGFEGVDLLLGGDLLNQITSSSFVARELSLPFLGLYSACSTMSESLVVGAALIDGGFARRAVCGTVSHFASAERQYRFPLEQGTQRPPISQWTVTGAGACVLARDGVGPKIVRATVGKVVDFDVHDTNNMGAAMAPAAMDSILTHFLDTGTSAEDYDLILTGDLGILGSKLLCGLMEDRGFPIDGKHADCGAMIYEQEPEIDQGGSGAGCSASVLNSYIYGKLMRGELHRVLFVATGALLSSTSTQQGDSIPGIAHLVVIER